MQVKNSEDFINWSGYHIRRWSEHVGESANAIEHCFITPRFRKRKLEYSMKKWKKNVSSYFLPNKAAVIIIQFTFYSTFLFFAWYFSSSLSFFYVFVFPLQPLLPMYSFTLCYRYLRLGRKLGQKIQFTPPPPKPFKIVSTEKWTTIYDWNVIFQIGKAASLHG